MSSATNQLQAPQQNQPSLEELQKIYQMTQQKKQKQCEYQKKYVEKKKNETQETIRQLQEQNQRLMLYYQLFESLKLQNPQLADQLINQLRAQNSTQQVTQISSPAPLGSQYNTNWPMVSLQK
jgi:hypothetical protein